jgi:hypothetical protein
LEKYGADLSKNKGQKRILEKTIGGRKYDEDLLKPTIGR